MRTTTAIVASSVLILAACGGGSEGSGVTSGRSDSVPVTTPDVTEPSESTDVTNPGEVTSSTAGGGASVTVGQTGFTVYQQYGRTDIVAAAEVVNDGPDAVRATGYEASLFDGAGTLLDETRGTLGLVLLPGETAWVLPNFYPEEGSGTPASMSVTIVDAVVVGDEITVANGSMPVGPAVNTVSAVLSNDINSVTHLEAVFHNETDARLTNVEAVCGIYEDGALVAGVLGWISEILPGGDAGVDSSIGMMATPPFTDDVRCLAGPVNITTYEPGVTSSGLEVVAGLTFNPAGGGGTHYDTMVGVTVHNPTAEAAFGVHVEVDLLDAAGHIIEVTVPSETYVLPGETLYTGIAPIVSLDSAPPASAVARTRVDSWGDPTAASLGSVDGLDLTAYPFEVSGTSAYMSVGLMMFGGTLTTTGTANLGSPVISCAAMDGSVPVAGSSWTLRDVPAGVPTTFEIITSFGVVPAYDEVRCTMHITSLTDIS